MSWVSVFVASALDHTGGLPVAPLDDTFIHLQYARSIAEGHAFAYHPGEPPSSGASSIAWATLLALPHLFGARGLDLLWADWILSALFVALLLFAAARVARTLGAPIEGGGRDVAPLPPLAAPLGLLAWGWLGWHLASGMEVALAAALVMGSWWALLAWEARPADARTPRAALGLGALGALLPLVRPEAAPLAGALALGLFFWPARGAHRWRALGALPVLGGLFVPFFWWLVTGTARSNGARNKWIFSLPYFDEERLRHWTTLNLEKAWGFFSGTGGEGTEGYFPPYLFVLLFALGLLVPLLHRRRRALVLLVGGTLACALATLSSTHFDSHRFRYLMPFLPPLLLLALRAAHALGGAFARGAGSAVRGRAGALSWSLAAGALAWTSWPEALPHYGAAASEIAQQHVVIARAIRGLPANARVAINDAGVLAYLGERPTLDVVGLTTNHSVTYYLAGVGSEHELFEALPPARRPTHFAVYPRWWRARHFLGRAVASASVPGPRTAIVGGTRMVLHEARLEGLDRGEEPLRAEVRGERVDALDVADTLDERAHGYEAEPWRWIDDTLEAFPIDGELVREGGRVVGRVERFELAGRPGRALTLVLRAHAEEASELRVRVNGAEVGALPIAGEAGWEEPSLRVPAEHVRERNAIEVRRSGWPVGSFHWWAFATDEVR